MVHTAAGFLFAITFLTVIENFGTRLAFSDLEVCCSVLSHWFIFDPQPRFSKMDEMERSHNSTLQHCLTVVFPAPLFGTSCRLIACCSNGGCVCSCAAGNYTPGTGVSSYAGKSQTAHIILGSLILCMVASWCAFILDYVKRVKQIYVVCGVIQMIMGLYLTLWLYVLLHPSDLAALYRFSSQDLVQLQHSGDLFGI
jgi:hypothetical protein